MNTIKGLAALLLNTPSGSVQGETRTEVVNTLQECWHEFEGSSDNKMAAYKLERVENMTWQSPVLSFVVERHGAMALGSTRAELQQWELDLETKIANCSVIGKRQPGPLTPRLDVKSIAAQVYDAVRQGPESNSDMVTQDIVIWKSNDHVLVQHGKLVSGTNQWTMSDRRKRFRKELELLMAKGGWEFVGVAGHRLSFKKRDAAN